MARAMQRALDRTELEPGPLNTEVHELIQALLTLRDKEDGLSTKNEVGEINNPSTVTFLRVAWRGFNTTYGPTEMHKEHLETAIILLAALQERVDLFTNKTIPALEKKLIDAGAPVILK